VKWRIYKAREDVQLALAREGITFGDDETPEPRSRPSASSLARVLAMPAREVAGLLLREEPAPAG
jgi:hypothetical protein